ncbi:MAG: glycosyltransferase family 39 protein [Anaerolineae bacterium]|jgi:hypothetical protein|nr:glycosyltransferase family 39 protein [Anaerolineae bacterium]
MKTIVRILSLIFTGIFLTVGFIFLLLSIGQYETLQTFLNQLAPDGSLESFTPAFHAQFRIPFLFLGGILFILGGISATFRVRFKEMLEETIRWLPDFIKAIWEDAKEFFKLLIPQRMHWWEIALLLAIMLAAIAGRWTLINRPMMHDESYTFIAFARHDLRQVISDYHLPNNHIFNSVLIHFFYEWIGNPGPIVVRFPAFIAGILVCLSGYFFTRREYGQWPALAASAVLAVFPWLKLQSVNGRGYMLMALFTIWMLSLAFIVRRKRNRFAWVLLIFVSVLNFWTLPIALYPFAIITAWLLLSAIIGDMDDAYDGLWNFLKYLIGFGVASGVVTFLLYSPVFLMGSGWNSFFHNPFVTSLDWNAFTQTLPLRLTETLEAWRNEVPVPLAAFLLIGGIFYPQFRKSLTEHRVSLPLVTLLVLTVIFVIQKPNPWTRIWTYLLSLVIVWCVVGWFALAKTILKPEKLKIIDPILAAAIMVVFLVFGIVHTSQNLDYFRGGKGQVETVTLWLDDEFDLTEKDIILTSMDFSTAFWYYLDLHGIPLDTVLRLDEHTTIDLIYLIVDDRENEDYRELFAGQPIAPELCPPEVVELVHEYGHYTVYQCNAVKP